MKLDLQSVKVNKLSVQNSRQVYLTPINEGTSSQDGLDSKRSGLIDSKRSLEHNATLDHSESLVSKESNQKDEVLWLLQTIQTLNNKV